MIYRLQTSNERVEMCSDGEVDKRSRDLSLVERAELLGRMWDEFEREVGEVSQRK